MMYQSIAFLLLASLGRVTASPLVLPRGGHRHNGHHHQVREINQIFSESNATPFTIDDGIGNGTDRYVLYRGDGTPLQGWPTMDEWVSFENMFNNSREVMRESCKYLEPDAPLNTEEEIDQIWNAVQSNSYQSGVDHRFILAIIMQESKGCTRIHTTKNSVPNPGLMQDHQGTSTCNFDNGTFLTPCPEEQISGMIDEGVRGTATGDGLAGILKRISPSIMSNNDNARLGPGSASPLTDDVPATAYYRAARIYNSGSEDADHLENGLGSTNCYASDVANRLTGWVSAGTACDL